jgi:type III pantothenate kinase
MGNPHRHLAIDIGNSGTKAALFHDDELQLPVFRSPPNDWATIDEWVTNLGVENIIFSTVANVPSDRWIDKWKRAGVGVRPLGGPLPFPSDYATPATLGQDRIAAIAGARTLARTTCLVVDAGSCLTLDLVDGNGRHRGGNISPGVRMRLEAMHARTARLPLVEPDAIDSPTGWSTETALRHGGQLGCVYEIEGLRARLLTDHPELTVVLTGGDGERLLPNFSVPVLFYPHLVLRGLHQILSLYVN